MFARASSFKTKVVDRKKFSSQKISFTLQVHKITLPNSYKSGGDEEIGVTLQRGNRTAATGFRLINPKSSEVEFNESLSVECTMFATTNSRSEIVYQPKPSKITVRARKVGKSPTVVGVATIAFDKYALAYAGTDLTLALEQCTVLGASVQLTVIPQVLGESGQAEKDVGTTDLDGSSHFSSDEFVMRKTRSLRLSGTNFLTADGLNSDVSTIVGPPRSNAPSRNAQRSKSMYIRRSANPTSSAQATVPAGNIGLNYRDTGALECANVASNVISQVHFSFAAGEADTFSQSSAHSLRGTNPPMKFVSDTATAASATPDDSFRIEAEDSESDGAEDQKAADVTTDAAPINGSERQRSASVRFRTPMYSSDDLEVGSTSESVSDTGGGVRRSTSVRFTTESTGMAPLSILKDPQRSAAVRFTSPIASDDSATAAVSAGNWGGDVGKVRRASVQVFSSTSHSGVSAVNGDGIIGSSDGASSSAGSRRKSMSTALVNLFGSAECSGQSEIVNPNGGCSPSMAEDETTQMKPHPSPPVPPPAVRSDNSSDCLPTVVDFEAVGEENIGSIYRGDVLNTLDRMGELVWDIQNAQDRLLGSVHYHCKDPRLSGFVAGIREESEVTSGFLATLKQYFGHLEASTDAFVNRTELLLTDKQELESELDRMRVEQHMMNETEQHVEKIRLMREAEKHSVTVEYLKATLETCQAEVAELSEKLQAAEELEASHNLETYYLNQGRVELEKKYEKLKTKVAKMGLSLSSTEDRNSVRKPAAHSGTLAPAANTAAMHESLTVMHEMEMERVYRKVAELKSNFIRYRARVDVRRLTHTNALLMEQMMRMNTENELTAANKVIVSLRKQVSALEDSKKQAQSQATNLTTIESIDDMTRDDLVKELINAKVQVASLAMENDEEKRRVSNLKSKINIYSKRILNLEVELGS